MKIFILETKGTERELENPQGATIPGSRWWHRQASRSLRWEAGWLQGVKGTSEWASESSTPHVRLKAVTLSSPE